MSDLFEEKNIAPMLMYETQPFDDEDCIFELKLDGIRCIAYLDRQGVYLQNKRFLNVTARYPELLQINECSKNRCILDGELVVFENGKPDFYGVQKRSLMTDEMKIRLASARNPVQFVAYDILYFDNRRITHLPLMERKKILSETVKEGNFLSVSRHIEECGKEFFELVKRENLEGIVAKKKEGLYYIGKRTREWQKIKVMRDEDYLIFGYQPDENGRVKDVIVGDFSNDGTPRCAGKVYLGISAFDRETIQNFAIKNFVNEPWFPQYQNAVWIKPRLKGTVKFMQETPSGHMRQPVWKGLRNDG